MSKDGVFVTPAAVVVMQRLDHGLPCIYLQKRVNTGYMDEHWGLVGGGLQHGESIHEAAVREVEEETGVHIAITDLKPLTTLHSFPRHGALGTQRIDVFFVVTNWMGEPVVKEPDQASADCWVPLWDFRIWDTTTKRRDNCEGELAIVPKHRFVLQHLRDHGLEKVQAVMSLPFSATPSPIARSLPEDLDQ